MHAVNARRNPRIPTGAGLPAENDRPPVAGTLPLAAGLLALVLAATAWMPAGATDAPAPPLSTAEAGAARTLTTAAVRAPSDTRTMNLDVQGADLRNVLHSIAEFAGTNIVPDREIGGPVAVRLVQVPWRQALDIVCQSAGLVAIDGDGFIRVATLRAYREEGIEHESAARKREELLPLETRIFTARYAAAAELRDAVSFALSKRGSSQVDERTNSLLVYDTADRLAEVARLVLALDSETQQVEIVARLVDVDKMAARAIGIDWTLSNLHATAERISGSAAVHEGLVNPSGIARIGVIRDWGDLDATFEALERENHARIISNPKITTVNNRRARILVGREVPLIVLDEAGNPVTELKRVGITLEVTPYINSENRITMDLHPEVSDLSTQATVQGGLIFNTTLADTRVMVNDGETAVIGGLIRTSETEFRQGIPILRSIPLLGVLFGKTDIRRENRELLIFVTPRVVQNMAQH